MPLTSSFPSFLRLSLITASLSLVAPLALAQVAETDQPVKEVENSKFSTSGIITSNAVYIRCGPGDNYYPTIKLDKGAKVKVVGAKFDWLKVVPPDGSFCYVARLYVDRHGDGKVGRVNKDSINVRAGSALSALKIGILCELNQGEEVEILGEEQEYFKIKPPAKAYLYVNKKFVEPDPAVLPETQVAKTETTKPETTKPEAVAKVDPTKPEGPDFGTVEPAKPETTKPETTKPEIAKPEIAKTETPAKPEVTTPAKPEVTSTDPTKADTVKTEIVKSTIAQAENPKVETTKPEATKPEVVMTPQAAEDAFDKAESAYLAARAQPLDKQPIAALITQFETVAKSDALPESMRRLAESRLVTLKAKVIAQAELVKLNQSQGDLKQKQMALEAEQQELQKRIADTAIKVYTAVGTLQPSSLQQGQGTLYRVTDPATGRTVCYLRSNDPKPASLIGQFVGVRGALNEEARLGGKVITPAEITPIDASKVNTSITAQIIPQSLQPKEPATANTDPAPQP